MKQKTVEEKKKETEQTAAAEQQAAENGANQPRSIEESFAALDEMVRKMEREDVTLEESFHLYRDGMKLLKEVNDQIDGYEKQIRILSDDGGTEAFE